MNRITGSFILVGSYNYSSHAEVNGEMHQRAPLTVNHIQSIHLKFNGKSIKTQKKKIKDDVRNKKRKIKTETSTRHQSLLNLICSLTCLIFRF